MESEQHIIFTGQTGSRGITNDSRLSAQMLQLSAVRCSLTLGFALFGQAKWRQHKVASDAKLGSLRGSKSEREPSCTPSPDLSPL